MSHGNDSPGYHGIGKASQKRWNKCEERTFVADIRTGRQGTTLVTV